MDAIDTNIWIYSHDNRDSWKQRIALELIGTPRRLALPWQVGCEFIAASRKLAPYGFTEATAWASLEAMQAMTDEVLFPSAVLWRAGKDLIAKYQLSYWDGMLAAACIEGGVQTLFTEDFGGSQAIEGMRIVNPFASTSRS
ncbi:MAG: PIN domain-containing protein [Pirellulaceae bacterium]|nr:PIN domain-containing protein [Pirellulaceae bacterium]